MKVWELLPFLALRPENEREVCGVFAFLSHPVPLFIFYGLVIRVPGYRSRGLGFDSRLYQIF
jgi:hypothetical protein